MKKVIALCMAALLALFTAPQVAQAATENVTMKVTADKENLVAGDTVNFNVSIGAVESLGGLEFTLNIPEGLTIVDSSIAIPDGLATVLDSDGDIIKPTSVNDYKWSYSAQMTGYQGTTDLTILTFACTVDANVTGAKNVTLNMSCCFDNINLDEHNVSVVPVSVTVGAVAPTEAPTAAPTEAPTAAPTEAPTAAPTEAPTAAPTEAPTAAPTEAPTAAPTEAPTAAPTEAPTAVPTVAPTEAPTAAPTEAPTAAPTEAPTAAPTEAPTTAPTEAPTAAPTEAPTAAPTEAPTAVPTQVPTTAPTQAPAQATSAPSQGAATAPVATQAPTAAPTQAPAEVASPQTGDGNAVVWLIGLLFAASAGVVLYNKKNRA